MTRYKKTNGTENIKIWVRNKYEMRSNKNYFTLYFIHVPLS